MGILVLYCTVVYILGFPTTAYAYLDPGTGSLLLQGLAAVFLMAGMYFRRVLGFVKKHVLTKRLGKTKR